MTGPPADQVATLEVADGVAVISLCRPEVRNAVDHRVTSQIEAHLDAVDADRSVRVGIITGVGAFFCAGADLRMIADGGPSAMTERGGFAGFVERPRRIPFIAAVEGGALAGGFEIVLSCDLVVCGSDAVFGLPEVRRALLAGGGGLVRLPHRIPRNVAMELAVTGGNLSASDAHRLGLVNRLVPAGATLDAARRLADEIAPNPTVSVEQSRAVVVASAERGEDHAWSVNAAAMAAVQASEDYAEGPRAFLERREPRWSGR